MKDQVPQAANRLWSMEDKLYEVWLFQITDEEGMESMR